MKRLIAWLVSAGLLGAAAWGGWRAYGSWKPRVAATVPVTRVKRGDVTFTVTAKGSLQGGNSKMLTSPTTGARELALTFLRKPGEMVKENEVVAEFDTTEETYKLREAEADLAEAEQQVIQAQNETLAREEELNYELIKARADVKIADYECQRNPLLPEIKAKQNVLMLNSAKERFSKIEKDYPERKAAAKASIAIQEAARKKAQVQAETARKNIERMTLKAPIGGYVNVERNTNSNFMYPGMVFPLFQTGDLVRAGMGVAQIPDTKSWEVSAQINEQDRGHLAEKQNASVQIVALSGRAMRGHIANLGGTTGPPWDRRFECKLALDETSSDLRPGMSTRLTITTQTLAKALWIPAQALFESDGRKFVYLYNSTGFAAKDVELVRRSESQVVLTGLQEGEQVALANPAGQGGAGSPKGGAAGAIKGIGK